MTVTATNRAYTGYKYIETSFELTNFRTVEYDGTNAADVITWVTNNSIANGAPYIWNDSGTLKVLLRATAMDSNVGWATAGAPVEVEVPTGALLLFQNSSFLGLLDSGQLGQFPTLA